MKAEILKAQDQLTRHPMYGHLNSVENIRIFMQHHVFAVWDFMCLLKRLQRDLTCVEVPWRPSRCTSKTTRLINEIVLCEESDVDQNGEAVSHYELYLRAMREIGASTQGIEDFLQNPDVLKVPDSGLRDFIWHHTSLAQGAPLHRVAASFFYGREKLLPDIFTSMVEVLKQNNMNCPTLIYYFERHIEVDGDEHGPMAEECLHEICGSDANKWREAYDCGLYSIKLRDRLWNTVLAEIQNQSAKMDQSVKILGEQQSAVV